MTEQPAAVVVADAPALTPDTVLPPGMKPTGNYHQAVELGHVLAKSGYYKDARDPAQAAVKVMIGLDLGVSPTAALTCIQTMEDNGRIVFLIEAKLLAAAVKQHPAVEYRIVERTEARCEVEFLRRGPDGEFAPEGPNVVWTIEKARGAVKGFEKKPTWKNLPDVMLTWRALAEGFRLYFPDILAGGAVYAMEEFDAERESLRETLEPAGPKPLTDQRAEELREEANAAYERLRLANPKRLPRGAFANALARAEHSHAALENRVGAFRDLADNEERYQELLGQLQGVVDEATYKAIHSRAERREGAAERIEVVEKAIAVHANGGEQEGSDDATE